MTSPATQTTLQELQSINKRLSAYNHALACLQWDEHVMMPSKGASSRAQALAVLSSDAHDLLISDDVARIIHALSTDVDVSTRVIVDELAYQHTQAKKVPVALVDEMSTVSSHAYHAWVEARQQADFSLFAPHFEKVVALHRRLADHLGYDNEPYDALLQQHERDMTTQFVQQLFDQAQPKLQALLQKITRSQKQVSIAGTYDEQKLHTFCLDVLQTMGYNFHSGRVDKTVHPFMIGLGHGDVRVTYRTSPDTLVEEITTIMHEGGHALYEQGLDEQFANTVAHAACSTAVHESQSRTWENIIGRSVEFWTHFYPQLQRACPDVLSQVSLHDFVRALNYVQPSFIRVDSDELTYNFHIFLRFTLERELISGSLSVANVPARWNELMSSLLGIVPKDDAQGCLQDVHWSGGIGYFSTYTLGNCMACQFMEKMQQDVPKMWDAVAQGDLSPVLSWQRQHIHTQNARFTPLALVTRVTGKPLSSDALLAYLERKYARILSL